MMTPAEMLDTVKEYQTTDSISRKNALFDLIRQRTWEVWFMSYQCARKLYLDYPLPEVAKILNWWPHRKDLEKYVDVTLIIPKSISIVQFIIILYGMTKSYCQD